MSGSNIALVLTGSIAAYKACEVISQLVQRGHRVRSVATESARHFVGAATLEGLTGQPVLGDLFASGAALEHIELSRWAEVVVICPATANTINRCAAGLADDLVGALFLAHDRTKPLVMAPAMNPEMWSHPATTAAVARLREWGVRFIPVGRGRTACGETGEGRLAEPAEIVAYLEAVLARPVRALRVLVTSGPTAEPVDGVRVLTNVSTGRTGAGIATYFARCGHRVTLLRARGAAAASASVQDEYFGSITELDEALTRNLATGEFDAVIHAAAVSDFAIEAIEVNGARRAPNGGKLDSDHASVLHLRRTPKLVDGLRERSRNPDLQIVAFKLTTGANASEAESAVQTLLARSGADWVVHNDLQARRNDEDFPAIIYQADGLVTARCPTRTGLAVELERLLSAGHPAKALLAT
ncbi:MAG: bifunctional phosphopantothenoylcysteine decarboxylase/phosphopantothenate--cysteine ligase CoaBC [Opitutaceae bacterium]